MIDLQEKYTRNVPVFEPFWEDQTPEGEPEWLVLGICAGVTDDYAIIQDTNGERLIVTPDGKVRKAEPGEVAYTEVAP